MPSCNLAKPAKASKRKPLHSFPEGCAVLRYCLFCVAVSSWHNVCAAAGTIPDHPRLPASDSPAQSDASNFNAVRSLAVTRIMYSSPHASAEVASTYQPLQRDGGAPGSSVRRFAPSKSNQNARELPQPPLSREPVHIRVQLRDSFKHEVTPAGSPLHDEQASGDKVMPSTPSKTMTRSFDSKGINMQRHGTSALPNAASDCCGSLEHNTPDTPCSLFTGALAPQGARDRAPAEEHDIPHVWQGNSQATAHDVHGISHRKVTACAAGNYLHAGTCIACPVGQAQPMTGQTYCTNCHKGFYAPTEGHSVCSACPAGRHQNATGEAHCESCPMGQAQPASGQAFCADCQEGLYTDFGGASVCVHCNAGQYIGHGAATACQTCSPGKYTLSSGAHTTCQLCLPDQY